jgi:hypothetical protein
MSPATSDSAAKVSVVLAAVPKHAPRRDGHFRGVQPAPPVRAYVIGTSVPITLPLAEGPNHSRGVTTARAPYANGRLSSARVCTRASITAARGKGYHLSSPVCHLAPPSALFPASLWPLPANLMCTCSRVSSKGGRGSSKVVPTTRGWLHVHLSWVRAGCQRSLACLRSGCSGRHKSEVDERGRNSLKNSSPEPSILAAEVHQKVSSS